MRALAAQCTIGDNFATQAKRLPYVSEWLNKSREFLPSVCCFDTVSHVIGATYAQFESWELLQTWEKEVRDLRISRIAKDRLGEARDVLQRVVEDNDCPTDEAGRAAIDSVPGLREYFSKPSCGVWWAMLSRTLEGVDQCAACQILFHDASLHRANSAVPYKVLGANFKSERGWQCAEADLCSLIGDIKHPMGSSALRSCEQLVSCLGLDS